MNRFSIVLASASVTLVLCATPSFAQDFNSTARSAETTGSVGDYNGGSEQKVSTYRKIASEAALLRYRVALKLTAAQEKYWPAAAAALRALSRQNEINETVVRRYAPAVRPLIASLDDQQRQVAMGLAAQAGLAQYAALF